MLLDAWAASRAEMLIPEGGEDVERREPGGATVLVSVKSRRAERGSYARGEVARFYRELDRKTRGRTNVRGELLLERPVEGCPVVTLERGCDCLDGPPAGTRTLVVPEPKGSGIAIIEARTGCRPVAAAIAFRALAARVGELADANGPLQLDRRVGLGPSDVEAIVMETLEAVDVDAVEAAIASGAVEPVDFVTPRPDAAFYLGVDVEPGHAAAGLVVERPKDRNRIIGALERLGRVIVCGPSGAGKSALMWDTAHATRAGVTWLRVRRLEQSDLPSLTTFLRALRVAPARPVGLVLDDVGRAMPTAWDSAREIASRLPGVRLLASCRHEDLALLSGIETAALVTPEADDRLAKHVWTQLRSSGDTVLPGWREAWAEGRGRMLEYTHLLSRGERLRSVIEAQVDARLDDPAREVETAAMRLAACAHAAGVPVETARLQQRLGTTATSLARALRRLAEEHLLRGVRDGIVEPLHALRSRELHRAVHRHGAPSIAATVAEVVHVVPADGLATLLTHHLGRTDADGGLDSPILDALHDRLRSEPRADLFSEMLRGLGAVTCMRAARAWLGSTAVQSVPPSRRNAAAMLAVSGGNLDNLSIDKTFKAAVRQPLDPQAAGVADLPSQLVAALDSDLVYTIVSGAGVPSLTKLLEAALAVGEREPLLKVLRVLRPPLDDMPIWRAAALLGAARAFEPSIAVLWVGDGGNALLARVPLEVAWAGRVRREAQDGAAIVAAEHSWLAEEHQGDANDAVVGLCAILLALCPDADHAHVDAVDASGAPITVGDHPFVRKRMARTALPTDGQVDWNRRRWRAVDTVMEPDGRTAFLGEAQALLRDIVKAGGPTWDLLCRGEGVGQKAIDTLIHLQTRAEQMIVPRRDPGGGNEATEAGAYQTLQNVLFHACAPRTFLRFRECPEGAAALSAHLGSLAADLDAIEHDPMWSLLESVPMRDLHALRDQLRRARLVAWATTDHQAAVRNVARKVGRSKALGAAAQQVQQTLRALGEALRAMVDDALQQEGIVSKTGLVRAALDGPPWPPQAVLILPQCEDLAEAAAAGPVLFELLRGVVPDLVAIRIAPVVADRVVGAFAMHGHRTLFPGADAASVWITDTDAVVLKTPCADAFDAAVRAAGAIGNMAAAGRGGPDAPSGEREAIEALEAERRTAMDTLSKRYGSDTDKFLDSCADAINVLAQAGLSVAGVFGDADGLNSSDDVDMLEAIGQLRLVTLARDQSLDLRVRAEAPKWTLSVP